MASNIDFNTSWRNIASTIYKKPNDSKIFGSVEIDITDLEEYIQEKRDNGLKITLTHIFMLATARALSDKVPEFNTYVSRGKIISHPSIDAAVSVLLPNGEMGSVKVPNADHLNLKQAVDFLNAEIQNHKKGEEGNTGKLRDKFGSIPWPFRNWLFKIVKTLIVDLGLSFPSIGLSANGFGSFILSNIGSLGLDVGYPALMPSANVAFVLIMGGVHTKPWVVNNQIIPRKIMSLSIAIDHRVADASHGGKLFKYLKSVINNPKVLE